MNARSVKGEELEEAFSRDYGPGLSRLQEPLGNFFTTLSGESPPSVHFGLL